MQRYNAGMSMLKKYASQNFFTTLTGVRRRMRDAWGLMSVGPSRRLAAHASIISPVRRGSRI